MARLALRELYLEELRDLYDAENRMIKALPKLAEAAESERLRDGFQYHLVQTRSHVTRLDQVFERLGEAPCTDMPGPMPDASAMDQMIMYEDFEEGVKDAALISAAQRVEHYEIAAYECVKTWAGLLGDREAQELLDQTLTEEKETEEKLTELSQSLSYHAVSRASGTEMAGSSRL
jgi:ferritin-like metal-binding protein YciE